MPNKVIMWPFGTKTVRRRAVEEIKAEIKEYQDVLNEIKLDTIQASLDLTKIYEKKSNILSQTLDRVVDLDEDMTARGYEDAVPLKKKVVGSEWSDLVLGGIESVDLGKKGNLAKGVIKNIVEKNREKLNNGIDEFVVKNSEKVAPLLENIMAGAEKRQASEK